MTTPDQDPSDTIDYDTRYNLHQALNQLPWSGSLAPPPRWDQGTDDQFMATVHLWLQEYGVVARTVRETNAKAFTELHDLRTQRDAVRAFLGTTQKGTT